MNELVFLKNKQALTTSLIVAKHFEKRHDLVIRDIRTLIGQMASVSQSAEVRNGVSKPTSPMFFESTYQTEESGRKYPMFFMNKDGLTLLAMGFTGEKALKFKLAFIQAFNAMEKALLNQQNEEWRAIRQAGKRGNKEMRAVIQQALLPLAREQGYDKPERFLYINYNNAINRAAKIQPHSRDELSLGQLYEVEKMQNMVEVSIRGLAAHGDNYKQIFKNTKQTLENYSRLSLIAERFLPA